MTLRVYPRRPITNGLGDPAEARTWRIDAIDLPPLLPGQEPAPHDVLEYFHAEFFDRSERNVPIGTLRAYDVQGGLDAALDAARRAA